MRNLSFRSTSVYVSRLYKPAVLRPVWGFPSISLTKQNITSIHPRPESAPIKLSNARCALLIGCPLGLNGVATDLNIMQSILEEYDFTCTQVCPATRTQILTAWNNIIEQTSQGAAVVIYYSGHGGIAPRMGEPINEKTGRRLRYLVPVDFSETKENDWRGIADVELSQLLRRTTDKSKNVTLILDCCYAARMARGPGTVKSIQPTQYSEVSKHIEKMRTEGKFGADFHHERNPDAVAIVASAETELAYEQEFGNIQKSVLTEALENVFQRRHTQGAACTKISWRSVMMRVRENLKVTCPHQYPQIEGDDLRFAFSLDKADLRGSISASLDGDAVVLSGGELHGLKPGDTYALLPFDEEQLNGGSEIAEVVVTEVGPVESRARIERISRLSQQLWKDGMKAFPKKRQLGRLPVALKGSITCEKLRDSVTNSRFLSVADTDECFPLATLLHEDSRLRLLGHEGSISFILGDWQVEGEKVDDDLVTECATKLESLARSRHLLTIEQRVESSAISKQIDVELSHVRDGNCEQWLGETLAIVEGNRLYLKIRNTGFRPVYVSIFDVCGESATLLSTSSPSGRELHQNESYTFGKVNLTGKLLGSTVSWPEGIPRGQGRIPEHIIVIVTDARIDLRVLETGLREIRGSDDASEVIELINNISQRNIRNVATEGQEYLQFGVRSFSFELICRPEPT